MRRRTSESAQSSVDAFRQKIKNTTLPCWDPTATLIKEDRDFIDNMKTTRTFTIGSLDRKRCGIAARRMEKQRKEDERKNRSEEECVRNVNILSVEETDDNLKQFCDSDKKDD